MTEKKLADMYDWLWPELKPRQQNVKGITVALPSVSDIPKALQLSPQSPLSALIHRKDIHLLLNMASVVVEDIQQDKQSLVRVGVNLWKEFVKNNKYDWDVWKELAQRKNSDALADTFLFVLMDRQYMPLATCTRTGFRVISRDGEEGLLERMVDNLHKVFSSDALIKAIELVRKVFPPQQPQQSPLLTEAPFEGVQQLRQPQQNASDARL